MSYHIVVGRNSREIVNAEVKRRNRYSSIKHTQQSVTDEIISEWEENRRRTTNA